MFHRPLSSFTTLIFFAVFIIAGVALAPLIPVQLKPDYTKKLTNKEVKVNSKAIGEIREEMSTIIEKGDAETLNESQTHTDNNLTPIYKGTKEGAYCSVVLTSKFILQKW